MNIDIDNRLVITPIERWSQLSHPLEWNNSEGAQQVQLPGGIAILLENSLYFSMGWISEGAVPQSMPIVQLICIADVIFSAPSILSILSDLSDTVELVAKYNKSHELCSREQLP